ncbi:MAG: hypothetical protein WA766_03930, partial [Candidatus Acidiferrales bacterium]
MRATTVKDGREVRKRLVAHLWRVLTVAVGLVCVLSTIGVLVGQTTASALGNGRFSFAPTATSGHPRQTFTPVVASGGTSTDEVSVANLTTSPIDLHLYAADAYNTPNGGFAIKPDFEPKVH